MLSCKDSSRLLSQREDRKLNFGERLALRLHLAICDACRNASAQFKFLRRAVRELTEHESPAGK
jgi:anti-sigma factor RsiW